MRSPTKKGVSTSDVESQYDVYLLIWSELSIPFISRGIVGCWG
jgi:hypothetical protein